MIALLIASLLSVSAHADFNASVAALKTKAVAKFLADANNPASDLGKIIAKENTDNTDGRNPDGIIAMPVKASKIQVTLLSAENMLNPWHYGEHEGTKCVARGHSATFLIALAERTGVHAAEEYSTMLFQVSAVESFSFDASAHPDMNCQEAVDGAKVLKVLNVDPIKPAKLAE